MEEKGYKVQSKAMVGARYILEAGLGMLEAGWELVRAGQCCNRASWHYLPNIGQLGK